MGKRRRARELVLQFLFQVDMNPPEEWKVKKEETPDSQDPRGNRKAELDDAVVERMIASFWESFKTEGDLRPFFTQLADGVLTHKDEIDEAINGASDNWKLSRMAVVDRNILRLSVYEILYIDDIPPSVTINEAIEIAKRYGSADSPSFINGILDNISTLNKEANAGKG